MASSEHERFAAKVLCDLRTKCWLWTGAQCGSPNARHGYFYWNGKGGVASIYAWEQAYGSTNGLLVLHKRTCSSALCVRPSHLYLGTYKDNTEDRVSKIDTCKYGHPLDGRHRAGYRTCLTCNREQARRYRALHRTV